VPSPTSQPTTTSRCPGCGLELPTSDYPYEGYFHASRECWSVFNEVLTKEYENAVLFGRVHQLTVDSYAVQHAGGRHPDKSVAVHVTGLHLVLVRGLRTTEVAPHLQRLASRTTSWPHFEPPGERASLTIFDVAIAATSLEHEARVRAWASQVWQAWSAHHDAIAALADTALAR
jgi:hypothetical protein